MTLSQKINEDIKEAMKAKDRDRLDAIRAIKALILLEATKDGGAGEVEDVAVVKILQKLLKQRVDSAELYKAQNRADLAEVEDFQANIIKAYLPEMMSEGDVKKAVQEIIQQLGATSAADTGKVMGAATKALAGKVDNKLVASVVKELLQS
jgi:uncharacterized protein YqeY